MSHGIKESAKLTADACVTHMLQCRRPITSEVEHLADIIEACLILTSTRTSEAASPPELDINYLWSCINCGKRISTFCDFHINHRPHCQECNAEMEPAVAPPQGTPTRQDQSQYPWAEETMQIINKLTPDIKGKAFDPDWFLLRQRFEQIEEKQFPQGMPATELLGKSFHDSGTTFQPCETCFTQPCKCQSGHSTVNPLTKRIKQE